MSESAYHLFPNQIERNNESLTLREAKTDTTFFKNLKESIAEPRKDDEGKVVCEHGLLNPIVVRPLPGQEGKYAIVDGLQRLTAWKDVFGDAKPIPVHVLPLTELGVVKAQIQANALTLKTKPKEFAETALKLLDMDPTATVESIAEDLHVEAATLRQWFALTRLPEAIVVRINEGTLPASVGYGLARFTGKKEDADFWKSKQQEWLEYYDKIASNAGGLTQWMGEAAKALKAIKNEKKKGKEGDVKPGEVITPALRKKSEIEVNLTRAKEHFETFSETVRKSAESVVQNFPEEIKFIAEGKFIEGLEYCLSVDAETVSARRAEAEKKAAEKQSVQDEKKAGKKADSIARSTSLSNLFGKK